MIIVRTKNAITALKFPEFLNTLSEVVYEYNPETLKDFFVVNYGRKNLEHADLNATLVGDKSDEYLILNEAGLTLPIYYKEYFIGMSKQDIPFPLLGRKKTTQNVRE